MRRLVAPVVLALVLSVASPAGTIINGTRSAAGAWPSLASMTSSNDDLCGGSLVAPNWVLTAAHCVYDKKAQGLPPGVTFSFAIGATDLTANNPRINVAQVVLHPNYNPATELNDVALMRLATASSAPVQELAARGETTAAGVTGTVIGFGRTQPEGGQASDFLLQTQVPIISDQECAADWGPSVQAARHVCAGNRGTESAPANDSCQGDSGGPLFVPSGSRFRQVGVVSFGGQKCGIGQRGVYAEVAAYRDWIDAVTGASPGSTTTTTQPAQTTTTRPGSAQPPEQGAAPADPANPDPADEGAEAPFFRSAPRGSAGPTNAVTQAAAVSFDAFDTGEADSAVLARADLYPDALGGATLAYGTAPLLFTDASGSLPKATRDELVRAVPRGSPVYLLGGVAAIPASIDSAVSALGFTPVRIAGADRFATARLVADEVVATIGTGGRVPADTMIVATGFNWPDAVTGGQLGAWWGMPVLLTPPDALHESTRAAIQKHRPAKVLVLGGTTVVSDAVVAQIQALGPMVTRLGGATRWGTSAAIFRHHLQLFTAANDRPDIAVAVNLRRADGFAHVLSASMLAGAFAGTFVPLDGENGSTLTAEMASAICGKDLWVLAAGGTDVVTDAAADRVRGALAGQSCTV